MQRSRPERRIDFGKIGPWVEPAHPSIVRLHDDLVNLYQVLHDKLQEQVDRAFDRVSRQIGFVVTTTVPVSMAFEDGKLRDVKMGSENLQGTLFEEMLLPIAREWGESVQEQKLSGEFKVYMLWHEALKLRLRTDWMEPAHNFPGGFKLPRHWDWVEPAHWTGDDLRTPVRPEVQEPAHWFDPRLDITLEDKLIISVIDEVYTDLHLVERIGGIRERVRDVLVAVRPEVQEPAHFRPQLRVEEIRQMLNQIQDMLKEME